MHIEIIPVTAFQQNCSLVWDDELNAAIIDPGGEADRLIQIIEQQHLKLEKILLTHGHLDHVGAASRLRDYFGVEIVGPHSDDAFLFNSLPEQSERFGFTKIDAFLPDCWSNVENDVISVGQDIKFRVLHLPGHTPGHIGFIEENKNIALTGDVLFYDSVGRTDFPRSDHHQLMTSIKHKLLTYPDDMIVVPGHGPTTKIGRERQHNPFVA